MTLFDEVILRAETMTMMYKMMAPANKKYQAELSVMPRHGFEIIKQDKSEFKIGIELELEFKKLPEPLLDHSKKYWRSLGIITRNILRDKLGNNWFSVQEDGTLANGFEVVTAPVTVGRAESAILAILNDPTLSKAFRKMDTAGLHITVDPFSSVHRERVFFNVFNAPRFVMGMFETIGRTPNNYCKLRPPHDGVKRLREDKNKQHYWAVRCRHNKSLEVRLFKALYDPEQFLRQVALLDYVNRLCRRTPQHKLTEQYVINKTLLKFRGKNA